jgi:hypothetical protein
MRTYRPPEPKKPKVPDSIKTEVSSKAKELIERHLKRKHIKRPPINSSTNYLIDFSTRWRHNHFYFCALYACPGPDAPSPTFETRFARMEYAENGTFSLSYARQTGQWWEIYSGLSVDECLTVIGEQPLFLP